MCSSLYPYLKIKNLILLLVIIERSLIDTIFSSYPNPSKDAAIILLMDEIWYMVATANIVKEVAVGA